MENNSKLKNDLLARLKGETLYVNIDRDKNLLHYINEAPTSIDYESLFFERLEVLANSFLEELEEEDEIVSFFYDGLIVKNKSIVSCLKKRNRNMFERIVKAFTGCKEIEYYIADFQFFYDHFYDVRIDWDTDGRVTVPSLVQCLFDDEILLYKYLFDIDFIYSTTFSDIWSK